MCIVYLFVYPSPALFRCEADVDENILKAWLVEAETKGFVSITELGKWATLFYTNVTAETVADIPVLLLGYLSAPVLSGFLEWNSSSSEAQAMYEKLLVNETYKLRHVDCADAYDYDERTWTGSFDDNMGAFEKYVSETAECSTSTETDPNGSGVPEHFLHIALLMVSMFLM